MLSKVYVVVEYGGQYEDRWEHIVGVCSTPEVADSLKASIEYIYDPSNYTINQDTWYNMMDRLCEAEEDGFQYESEIEALHTLFPEYSKEDIEKAKTLYDYSNDYGGVSIVETDFYVEIPNETLYAN